MKYLLKALIKLYWLVIPESKRRNCIYRVSCSRQVYKITNEYGFIKGIKELSHRFKTCRPNHEIIKVDKENVLFIKLKDGTFLKEDEIAVSILEQYK